MRREKAEVLAAALTELERAASLGAVRPETLDLARRCAAVVRDPKARPALSRLDRVLTNAGIGGETREPFRVRMALDAVVDAAAPPMGRASEQGTRWRRRHRDEDAERARREPPPANRASGGAAEPHSGSEADAQPGLFEFFDARWYEMRNELAERLDREARGQESPLNEACRMPAFHGDEAEPGSHYRRAPGGTADRAYSESGTAYREPGSWRRAWSDSQAHRTLASVSREIDQVAHRRQLARDRYEAVLRAMAAGEPGRAVEIAHQLLEAEALAPTLPPARLAALLILLDDAITASGGKGAGGRGVGAGS